MSRIKGRDTAPELALRRVLWRSGYRYRLGMRLGRIRPDLVFVGARVAVFVDGCFWHGCPEHYVAPRTSSGFWGRKLSQNVERDRRQTDQLEVQGWKVVRLWEHEIATNLSQAVSRIVAAFDGDPLQGDAEELRVCLVELLPPDGSRERRTLIPLRGEPATRSLVRDRREAWARGNAGRR